MKATLAALFIVLGLQLSVKTSAGQSSSGLDSHGRDFFIGSIPSSNTCSNFTRGMWALVTSQFNATVTVSYFDDAGVEQPGTTYSIPKNSSKRIKLTEQTLKLRDPKGEGSNEFRACHIKANAPVSVQYYSSGPMAGGMYTALPTDVLGKEYVVQTGFANPGNGVGYNFGCPKDSSSSMFLIIAPYDNTQVEIHNTGLTMNGRRGICYGESAYGHDASFTVTLQRGQVYAVKSTNNDPNNSMDGSYIKSTKAIVVIAGVENAILGNPTAAVDHYDDVRDLTIEEMLPLEYWQASGYYSMPLRDSSPISSDNPNRGELYHVYSTKQDQLEFLITGKNTNPTDIKPYCGLSQFPNVTAGIAARSLDSSKIGVMMFDYRNQETNNPFPAPSQMLVIPEGFWKKFYAWMVPDDQTAQIRNFFCNVIANRDSIMNDRILISVNGGPGKSILSFTKVGDYEQIPGRPDLMGVRIVTSPGSFSLYGNTNCAVYLYGMEAYDINNRIFRTSYATPAGMSFRIKGEKAKVEYQSDCSGWDLRIYDSLDGLASVELLNDPDGLLLGKPYVSNNAQLYPLDYELVPGTISDSIRIQVRNPLADAVGYLYIVTRSGEDTLITFKYIAPKLRLTKEEGGKARQDSMGFGPLLVGKQQCSYFTLFNTSKGGAPFLIKKLKQVFSDSNFVITTTPTIPIDSSISLIPGDSLRINVCYTATDTGKIHFDSINIITQCFTAPLYVEGRGIVPVIKASDYTFPNTLVGDEICKTIRVSNVGEYDLTVGKGLLKDAINFSIDTSGLPKVLQPGKSVDIQICFHPTDGGLDSTVITWQNDIPGKYAGTVKDYSILKGFGIKPGLHWDRAVQYDTVPVNFTKIIRVYLVNSGTASVFVDSVVIAGMDPSEYRIINNQAGYDPLWNFLIQPKDSIWIDILFTPDSTKHNNAFVSRSMFLNAYSNNDAVKVLYFQTAMLEFSNVRAYRDVQHWSLYPNPNTTGDLTIDLGSGNGIGNFKLYDALGRITFETNLEIKNGKGNVRLPSDKVCKGIYVVECAVPNNLYRGKLSINK